MNNEINVMSNSCSSSKPFDDGRPTLVSIQGITASGKSDLAIQVAKRLTKLGSTVWIVNADSRQVYKKLNIGTAKVPGYFENINGLKAFYYQDIPHFLIDYIEPEINFGLVDYLKDFENLIQFNPINLRQNIHGDKIPDYIILVGGSGLYSKAVISGESPNNIKQEFQEAYSKMKDLLQSLLACDLQQKLLSSGFDRATINDSDWQNPRRLVNKILNNEAEKQGWFSLENTANKLFSKVINVAVQVDINDTAWISKLKYRVENWTELNSDLESEVKKLKYLGEEKIQQLGFEYSLTQDFLEGKLTRKAWNENLLIANRKYAKKQLTWLKKQTNLIWVEDLNHIINLINKK